MNSSPNRLSVPIEDGQDRNCLIVLGMHRSGTSALAGVLGLMGADLPNDLMAATEMNAKGIFESGAMTQLNEDLLASVGFSWWDTRRFPGDWFSSTRSSEFAGRAAAALHEAYGSSRLFVMKDPRMCRLVPFWLPVLGQSGCQSRIVHIHRHPLDVAASLGHWANYDHDYALLLWLRHTLDAEADTRGKDRCFVTFGALMSDWRSVVAKIGDELGADWQTSLEEAGPQVEAFLDKGLHHFSQQADEDEGPLPELVRQTLDILDRWATQGEQAEDHPGLDALRERFDGALEIFAPLARRTQELSHQTRHLATQLRELGTDPNREQSAAELNADLQRRLDDLERDADDTQSRQGRTRDELHQATSALAQRTHENSELYDQLDAARTALADMERNLEQSEQQRHETAAALQLSSTKLNQMTALMAARMRRDLTERLSRKSTVAVTPHPVPDGTTGEAIRASDGRGSSAPPAPARNDDAALKQQLIETESAAQARIAELESQAAELLNSTSWRVTAPIRRAAVVLRKLRSR